MLVDATFKATTATPYEAEIARDRRSGCWSRTLMTLAARSPMPQVRAIASHALKNRMTAPPGWCRPDR